MLQEIEGLVVWFGSSFTIINEVKNMSVSDRILELERKINKMESDENNLETNRLRIKLAEEKLLNLKIQQARIKVERIKDSKRPKDAHGMPIRGQKIRNQHGEKISEYD